MNKSNNLCFYFKQIAAAKFAIFNFEIVFIYVSSIDNWKKKDILEVIGLIYKNNKFDFLINLKTESAKKNF